MNLERVLYVLLFLAEVDCPRVGNICSVRQGISIPFSKMRLDPKIKRLFTSFRLSEEYEDIYNGELQSCSEGFGTSPVETG